MLTNLNTEHHTEHPETADSHHDLHIHDEKKWKHQVRKHREKFFNRELPPLIKWRARASETHEKGKTWFTAFGVIILMLVVYFLLTDSIIPAIAFILFAGVYYLAHNTESRVITIEINELGIKVEHKFYAFAELYSFWITYNPPYTKTLNFQIRKNRITTVKTILLGEQNPAEIRNFLRGHVPEVKGRKDGVWDIVSKMLRI